MGSDTFDGKKQISLWILCISNFNGLDPCSCFFCNDFRWLLAQTNQPTNQPTKKKDVIRHQWLVPKNKCVNHECPKLGFFSESRVL
jgi:hypothetical protein